jgi:hypothetical protein
MYPQEIQDRFWKKVKKLETGKCCWEWTTGLNQQGYGEFKVNSKDISAHRFSYQLHHNRLIHDGMYIMHFVCDNPKCVNPAHLKEGSHQDNMTDMVNKCRSAKGDKNGNSKLTEAQVLEIREKYSQGVSSYRKLGQEYEVSHTVISKIINYRIWAHI